MPSAGAGVRVGDQAAGADGVRHGRVIIVDLEHALGEDVEAAADVAVDIRPRSVAPGTGARRQAGEIHRDRGGPPIADRPRDDLPGCCRWPNCRTRA